MATQTVGSAEEFESALLWAVNSEEASGQICHIAVQNGTYGLSSRATGRFTFNSSIAASGEHHADADDEYTPRASPFLPPLTPPTGS